MYHQANCHSISLCCLFSGDHCTQHKSGATVCRSLCRHALFNLNQNQTSRFIGKKPKVLLGCCKCTSTRALTLALCEMQVCAIPSMLGPPAAYSKNPLHSKPPANVYKHTYHAKDVNTTDPDCCKTGVLMCRYSSLGLLSLPGS